MVPYTRLGQSVLFVTLLFAGCADPQSNIPQPEADAVLPAALDGIEIMPDAPPQGHAEVGPDVDAEVGPEVDAEVGPEVDAQTGPEVDAEPEVQDVEERRCEHRFVYTPSESVSDVVLATSFLDWGNNTVPLELQDDGTYALDLDLSELPPGPYGYKFIVDGDWTLDPTNKMRRFDDAIVNSKLLVPDCRAPELLLTTHEVDVTNASATIEVVVHPGVDTPIEPDSVTVTHNFAPLEGAWDPARGSVLVSLASLAAGKHTIRVDARGGGVAAQPLVVSFWVEETAFEWRDATLYFAFTDRFADGDDSQSPDSCLPADSIANWHGGDWPGITTAIEDGYFDSLGINTLWLNAPMDNPEGCDAGLYDRQYTAYHSYFPTDFFSTEPRFGTLQDLRALVTAAHARGMRVLVDLPANHVYDTAPEWTEHYETWFNIGDLCRDIDWSAPETCWFETYLPDLNHRNDEVVEHLTEVALMWAIDADLDGFRVDAVKHVHQHFLNTLRAKLDARIEAYSDQLFWTIGETFTGQWQPGGGSEAELIKAYISDDQLYGQFDFPLFWAVRNAFATRSSGLSTLADIAAASADYYGDAAIMGSFLGNHDVTRFISEANGDNLYSCPDGSSVPAWDCPPPQPDAGAPYERLRHAFVFLAAYPAVPLVYYGDEIGLAGGADPDNRRPMPWTALPPNQEQTRDHVSALLNARRNNVALRRGSFETLMQDDKTLVVKRSSGESSAYAVFNLSDTPWEVQLSVPDGTMFTRALDGQALTSEGGKLTLTVPAETAQLWTSTP